MIFSYFTRYLLMYDTTPRILITKYTLLWECQGAFQFVMRIRYVLLEYPLTQPSLHSLIVLITPFKKFPLMCYFMCYTETTRHHLFIIFVKFNRK